MIMFRSYLVSTYLLKSYMILSPTGLKHPYTLQIDPLITLILAPVIKDIPTFGLNTSSGGF